MSFSLRNKKLAKSQPSIQHMPVVKITGFFKSSIDDELETRLAGQGYIREFKKMADSDAICGAVLLAITKIFQSIEWKTVNDDKKVLERSLANVNWNERLDEILSFLIYGHDIQEVVYKKDDDGMMVWKGMYTRPQSTILYWNHDDNGDLVSITQQGEEGEGEADININRCLHFASMKTRNNPQGKSIFRNAYRDWYYRTNIERIEAIGIERDLTGIPIMKPSDNDMLVDEKGKFTALGKWAWQTVKNIKNGHQEGIVLPNQWEFDLQGSPGQGQFDLNKVIDRYDGKMALSMLSQFLILGVINNSGSFALAAEQSSLFYQAVTGFANMVAHTVNTQFIGAPAMALLNDIEQPKLVVVGINKPDLEETASFLGRLLKYNIITPDDKLEEHLRDQASLPAMDPDTARELTVNPGAKPGDDKDDEPTKKQQQADDEEKRNA